MAPCFPSKDLTSVFPTSSTKVMLIVSLLIAVSDIFSRPCHAENNTPPILKLSIALVGIDGNLSVSESLPLNSLLGLLETEDSDSGPAGDVMCRTDSKYVGLSLTRKDMYKITLKNHLDRETEAIVVVSIDCTDHGSPPITKSVVFSIVVNDANDNTPLFSQRTYTFSVKENMMGMVVGIVQAVDKDLGENAAVSYFLENEDGEIPTHFVIDELKGEIKCIQPLDREMKEEVVLYVYAGDNGFPPLDDEAEIRIKVLDVNDNLPVIVTKNMSIDEGLKPMSLIGTVIGTDKDVGINAVLDFSIAAGENGSPLPPFIMESNGDIYAAVPLDRERKDRYVIKVSVSDSGDPSLSSEAFVTINVLDVNDHPPVITSPKKFDEFDYSTNSSDSVIIDWYAPEGGKIVYRVLATDKDKGDNGMLFYAIDSINSKPIDDDSLFGIDEYTGDIYLRRLVRGEDDEVQVLSLLVYDGGQPSLNATASLNVTLDIDFSALTPPPAPSTEISMGGSENSASRVNSFSLFHCHLFQLCFIFLLFIIVN